MCSAGLNYFLLYKGNNSKEINAQKCRVRKRTRT